MEKSIAANRTIKPREKVFLYRPTASMLKDIISPTGKESGAASQYLNSILRWTFFGSDEKEFTSFYAERGKELEAAALESYNSTREEKAEKGGFIFNKNHLCGCYPDGMSVDGCVEIKCLKRENHNDILKNGIPLKFKPQLQGTLLITGQEWIDFVAYHPDTELYVERVYQDVDYVEKMKDLLAKFNLELNKQYLHWHKKLFKVDE